MRSESGKLKRMVQSFKRLFLTLILTTFLASCSSQEKRESSVLIPLHRSSEVQAAQSPMGSIEHEKELGRLIAARLLGDLGYYNNVEVTRYLNLIGQSLSYQAGRPELEYVFGVLDTGEPLSFGLPGGYVLVSRGLLKSLRSESELAYLVAREIARVNSKWLLSQLHYKDRVWEPELVASLSDQALKILGSRFSSADIVSADSTAAIYVMVTGYNADALGGYLDRANKKKVQIPMAESKITPRKRLAALKNFLKRNEMKSGTRPVTLGQATRFRNILANDQ
jgi:predicted Zn-dependent protease